MQSAMAVVLPLPGKPTRQRSAPLDKASGSVIVGAKYSAARSGRYGSYMVYDSDNNRGFLFAGRSSSILDDTWVYHYGNNSWSQIITATRPDNRYWHGMTYDPNNQKMIIFGGRHLGAPGEALDDTWTFDLSSND